MKKNIIIISYAYPPMNVIGAMRPYYIASNLDISKYNITIITSKPISSITPIDSNHICYSQTNKDNTKIRVINIKDYIGSLRRYVKKPISNRVSDAPETNLGSNYKFRAIRAAKNLIYPDEALMWYYSVKTYLNKNKDLINNTDIVLSTYPFISNHNIARYMKQKNSKIKWIADFRDYYFQNNLQNELSFSYKLHKQLEAKCVRQADRLIFVTNTMLNSYQKAFPVYKEKMYCIYNGVNRQDVSEEVLRTTHGKIIFFYAGSFYQGLRSPLPLLKLLDKAFQNGVLRQEDVIVNIAGQVDQEIITDIERFESASCIEYLGQLPRNEVIKRMRQATFLWLIVANVKAHYQTVPGKLFEYIAARRPIVNFAPQISEASNIVNKFNLGYNFDTLNSDDEVLYSTFQDLVNSCSTKDIDTLLPISNIDYFSWEKNALQLENIIDSL